MLQVIGGVIALPAVLLIFAGILEMSVNLKPAATITIAWVVLIIALVFFAMVEKHGWP